MKSIKVFTVCLSFLFFAISSVATANEGAEVINWGKDGISCSAFCGDVECVVGGQLTTVVNDESALLVCSSAVWAFDPPERAAKGGVNCGFYGTGQYVITPSGVVNFTCHRDFDD